MPERFGLEYIGADNQKHVPVIIHRAPFGSLERFLSILIEHYAGNFPFWNAPVQVSVLPIGEKQYEYANNVFNKLKELGFRAEVDLRSEKVNRKIAESEQQKIPFAFVVGQKEEEEGTVSVREHLKGNIGVHSLEDMLKRFEEMNNNC